MKHAIQIRTSKRNYTVETLTESTLNHIHSILSEINGASGLNFELVLDQPSAFSSFKKSYGLFKNVKSFIVLKGLKSDPHLREKVGYHGETLVLKLTELGLGTCWVGGTFDSKDITVSQNEELVCVITVGYIYEKPTFTESTLRKLIHRKVKPISEKLTSDATPIPEWVIEGMEAVLMAPSAANSQKPVFKYENGILTASVPDTYRLDLVDLGIAKRHFDVAVSGHFEMGQHGRFIKDSDL